MGGCLKHVLLEDISTGEIQTVQHVLLESVSYWRICLTETISYGRTCLMGHAL